MKAKTQYTDYSGTSAADESDHTTLDKLLESYGVKNDQYHAIGAEFYAGYDSYFSAHIYARDLNQSTKENDHIVKFEVPLQAPQFLSLFKRFNVIITRKGYDNFEIQESITLGPDDGEE
jgi:hypothetical protein